MGKMTEKIYNNQKEDEDVRKRCSEKIKNDNELYNYIMRMHYTAYIMFFLGQLLIFVGIIGKNNLVERVIIGVIAIIVSAIIMWVAYYRNFIKPLKQNKEK